MLDLSNAVAQFTYSAEQNNREESQRRKDEAELGTSDAT